MRAAVDEAKSDDVKVSDKANTPRLMHVHKSCDVPEYFIHTTFGCITPFTVWIIQASSAEQQKPVNLFASTVTTQLVLGMSASSKGYQTATGVDGDGGVHTSSEGSSSSHYSLFSCLFQPPLPFSLPVPSTMSSSSSLLHVFALAISLILLLTLCYVFFVAITACLRSIMPNTPDGRVLRSLTRQEELNKPLETHFIVTEKDRFSTEQEIFLDAKRNIVKAAGPTELVYLDITPACGALIADSLAEDSARSNFPACFRILANENSRIHFNSAAQTLRITIMPTEVHDSCQGWVNKGIMGWFVSGTINIQEFDCLCFRVGTSKSH